MALPNSQFDSPTTIPAAAKLSFNWFGPASVKIFITVASLTLLIVHLGAKPLDTVALGILALGLLPWLPAFLDMAELPGGVKFQFAKVQQEQKRQAKELEWIKLLIDLVISDYERTHLRALAADGPFMAEVKNSSTFEWELRHLLTLQLIDRHTGQGIRTLFKGEQRKNVKEHLFITERGRQYLRICDEASS
ncbi:MAG: hypothetical protein ACTS2F_25970 [Thainema sp.]